MQYLRWDRVIHFTQSVEQDADRCLNLPRRDRAARRVHGNDRASEGRRGLRVVLDAVGEQHALRVRELTLSAVVGDFPREQPASSGSELALAPFLIEEGDRETSLAVSDDGFQDRSATSTHGSYCDTLDIGKHRDGLAISKTREVAELAALGIAARVMV